VPSAVVASGLAPEKNQSCAKNYAILSKFRDFFPILQHKNFQHVTSASEKVGDYPAVLKVGGHILLSPACSDAYAYYCLQTLRDRWRHWR